MLANCLWRLNAPELRGASRVISVDDTRVHGRSNMQVMSAFSVDFASSAKS